jgi:hypothetical protein
MGILDNLAGTVGSLLTKFGQSVTYRTYSESYDPATGANTLTATDTTVKAMVEDYPARDAKGGETSGDGIVRGDRKVTVAANALSAAPTTEAKVGIGGVFYAIVKVDTQYGTDNALLYVLQVRK